MSNGLKEGLEWLYCIIIAIVLALIIRYFLGTPTVVKQESMYPTLIPNERLILNRLTRTLKKMPERGDVVTFQAPSKSFVTAEEVSLDNPVAIYNNEPTSFMGKFVFNVLEIGKTSYIKRVIGLPGEHVEIKDGKVFINGQQLEEKYLGEDVKTESLSGIFTDIVVPEDTLFLLGDNRPGSTDCRRFGCVPMDKIESTVVCRFWPLDKISKIGK